MRVPYPNQGVEKECRLAHSSLHPPLSLPHLYAAAVAPILINQPCKRCEKTKKRGRGWIKRGGRERKGEDMKGRRGTSGRFLAPFSVPSALPSVLCLLYPYLPAEDDFGENFARDTVDAGQPRTLVMKSGQHCFQRRGKKAEKKRKKRAES